MQGVGELRGMNGCPGVPGQFEKQGPIAGSERVTIPAGDNECADRFPSGGERQLDSGRSPGLPVSVTTPADVRTATRQPQRRCDR